MNINQLTASRIKELRTKNGLTAESVANALHISRGSYSQLENGHVEITLARVELLSQVFNVPIGELIPSTTTNHQSYHNNNGGINGNNNSTHTLNNFFAENEEKMQTLMDALKDVFSGKKGK